MATIACTYYSLWHITYQYTGIDSSPLIKSIRETAYFGKQELVGRNVLYISSIRK